MEGETAPIEGRLRAWLAALVVLVVGSALTVAGTVAAHRALVAREQRELAEEAQALGERLDERLGSYVAAQRTLAEVLDGTEVFSRDQFARLSAALGLADRYPEIGRQAFVQVVPVDALDAFVRTQRADGAPGFDVETPAGERDRYILTYAQNQAPLGTDLAVRPGLRSALERAGDSDATVVAGDLDPLRLLTPVYFRGAGLETVAERRAALRGWVTLTANGRRLLAEIATQPDVGAVRLLDPGGAVLASWGTETGLLGAELPVTRFGETWMLQVDGDKQTHDARQDIQIALLVGGVTLSLLVALLVGLLVRLRQLRHARSRAHSEAPVPADLTA